MESHQSTFTIKRLWIILATSMVLMFGVLLFLGGEIYQVAPPIPDSVETESGQVLFTKEDIQRGQNVWQSTGGMEQRSGPRFLDSSLRSYFPRHQAASGKLMDS